MIEPATTASLLRSILDIYLKLKNAFVSLSDKGVFLKETSISNIVEDYFSFEQLPKGDIKLIGKLSNFTLTSNYPAYTPFAANPSFRILPEKKYNPQKGRFETITEMKSDLELLHLPAISHNNIVLDNCKKAAKILWLYNEECKGLLLDKGDEYIVGRNTQNISKAFALKQSDRPIPVLVDVDYPMSQYLYRRVKIKGRVVTADLKYFEDLVGNLDSFLTDYMGNYFRPFANQGVLAIDLRKPNGSIELLEKEKNPFLIKYTVQGTVEVSEEYSIKKK